MGSNAGGHHEAVLEAPGQTLGHPRADTLPGAAQRASSSNQVGVGLIDVALTGTGCIPRNE
jgi:hypothetical protein